MREDKEVLIARLNARIHQQREEIAHLHFVTEQLKAKLARAALESLPSV